MEFEQTQIADDKKNLDSILRQIQEPVTYTLKKKSIRVHFLKRLPFVSRLIRDMSQVGIGPLKIHSLIRFLNNNTPTSNVSTSQQFISLYLRVLDFLIIPITYFSAFILNESVPFTLNNNARWLYSAVLLGLTLTAIIVPVTAPIIGLVTAGFSLSISVFLLGKALQTRFQLGREQKSLRREIIRAEDEMDSIQDEAKQLQSYLEQATDPDILKELYQQIVLIKERHKMQEGTISTLKEKEYDCNEKIKKLGLLHIVDKGIGLSFASLAVVALVTTLFLPYLGMILLTGVSITSFIYLTARLTVPIFHAVGSWIINKFNKISKANDEADDTSASQLTHDLDLELDDSTSVIFEKLNTGAFNNEEKAPLNAVADKKNKVEDKQEKRQSNDTEFDDLEKTVKDDLKKAGKI
ncbi:hypothetical protein [Legionella sp.]|uniref:hypothetical protein n=1 Tax=Legionella sp. TaxID=459 RepID=UPI003C9EBAEA